MTIRSRVLGMLGAVALGAALIPLASQTAGAAVTCPVVDSATGAVSPAPAPGVDWLGCNLTGAIMTGADLSGADLESTTLVNASLTNANLTSANLSGAEMSDTDFTGATLTGVQSGWINTNLGGPVTLPTNWTLVNGYLMGPGADLAGAIIESLPTALGAVDLQGANLTGAYFEGTELLGTNLTGADLTGANFTNALMESVDVSGAQFAGATFTQLWMLTYVLGGTTPVNGQAASLPQNWTQVGNYLLGPTVVIDGTADLTDASLSGADLWGANLVQANLTGANLTNANLYGAGVAASTSATWSDTTCPDATNSDNDGGSCAGHLTSVPVALATVAGASVLNGAPNWYGYDPQVVWNWTDLTGGMPAAGCTVSTDAKGEGTAVKVTASCNDANGTVGTQSVVLKIDLTTPVVKVTGVGNGKVYALGHVPAAGCTTSDALSGVATKATVKVTPAAKETPSQYKATCSGGVNGAGTAQSHSVSVSYKVAYGLAGFVAPRSKAVISRSAGVLQAEFRLAGSNGKPLAASTAAALARSGQVSATLAGPGIHAVTARCAWAKAGYFKCGISLPANLKTGGSDFYTITAKDKVGSTTVSVPSIGKAVNPIRVRFR